MSDYTVISEIELSGLPVGVDYHWDKSERRLKYWEQEREGRGAFGFYASPLEFLETPHWLKLLVKAGAEWFLPIIERMRNGEVFSREQLELLAAQHRDALPGA